MSSSGGLRRPDEAAALSSAIRNTFGLNERSSSLNLRRFRTIVQPGDGHCLFTSINYALPVAQQQQSGPALRKKLVAWIAANSYRTLGEVTIGQWIEWERGWTIRQYLNELKSGLWGGALEITLLSNSKTEK